MKTPAQIRLIVQAVQAKLDAQRETTGLDLLVPKGGYLEEDDWLSVVVTPAVPGIRAHQYVDALGQIEQELRASGVDHVLPVPALAD
jgi:hypothetical protein